MKWHAGAKGHCFVETDAKVHVLIETMGCKQFVNNRLHAFIEVCVMLDELSGQNLVFDNGGVSLHFKCCSMASFMQKIVAVIKLRASFPIL